MNKKEKELTAKMLNLASDVFSCHGCNDVDDEVYNTWTLDERKQFVKEFHKWNGDPEEYDEEILHLEDFCIMDFLAAKLRKEIKNENHQS